MNNQDLRVVKTLSSIESAFLTLLEKNDLDKITVTELARTARINKGTFYLHYTDIYDLYEQTLHKYIRNPLEESSFFTDFFDDPELFVDELSNALDCNLPMINKITRNGERQIDYGYLIDNIKARIYETGRIEHDLTNDMKLTAIFGSFSILLNEFHNENARQIRKLVADMIQGFFPQKDK